MHRRSEITRLLTAQHKPIDDITQATDLSETPNLSVAFETAFLKRDPPHNISTLMNSIHSNAAKSFWCFAKLITSSDTWV